MTLIFIFIADTSFAKSIQCASPSGESLSFQSNASEVNLSYGNGRGAQFTPVEYGPVRPISFGLYRMAYEELQDILAGFSLKWPVASCKLNSEFWLSACFQGGSLTSDPDKKNQIHVGGVNLSKLTENGASGEQVQYRFRVIFEKDGNTYFIPLVFPKDFCQVTGN